MYSKMGAHPGMRVPPLLNTVQNCLNVCDHMVTMMVGMPDVRARTTQILLLRDCAAICAALACYLARNSVFGPATASLCARICEACGAECARFPDPASQSCARVCMHCAQECRAFAVTGA